jgi:hypothetical protein
MHPRRRTENAGVIGRALLLGATLVLVPLLATGCSAGPAAPITSAAPPAPTITPLATPTRGPGEVVRSTFGGGPVDEPAGAMPTTGQLAVDVACWGADGSTMAWRLVAGDGRPLGLSGTADCSGPPITSWLGVTAAVRPATVRVRLDPGSGAVSGYAIVRRATP